MLSTSVLPYFNLSFRHWVIGSLNISMADEDVDILFRELGLPDVEASNTSMRLKQASSILFQEQSPMLVRLFEHLVQWHLMQKDSDKLILEELNTLLPPGLAFSLVTGRFLKFESEFLKGLAQEEGHVWDEPGSGTTDGPRSFEPSPRCSEPLQEQVTSGPDKEQKQETTEAAPHNKTTDLAVIQNRRLKLLENAETGESA